MPWPAPSTAATSSGCDRGCSRSPRTLLDEVDPASFDVIGAYAEPLPVLVIAELVGLSTADVPSLRRWSQAIVRMYEPSPPPQVVEAAVAAAQEFAALVREHLVHRRAHPGEDLTTDLLAAGLSDDELVAAVVLLLNAGHEASVNVFGNGLVALLSRGLRPAEDPALTVEEMLRFDSALQLFERTATASVTVGDVVVEEGQKIAALLGAANRDPAVFDEADAFDPARTPNPHLAFGAGLHFCLGRPARPDGARGVAGRCCSPASRASRWPGSPRAGGRSCCGATGASRWAPRFELNRSLDELTSRMLVSVSRQHNTPL